MLTSAAKKAWRFKWIGGITQSNAKKAALLIPQYNESGHCNFEERLAYFQHIKEKFEAVLDVIIIDDGSTDDSLTKLKSFTASTHSPFSVASVYPNANKVGALYATILSIKHEFIILSDFDTDITGLEQLTDNLDLLRKDKSLMGGYFRMLPFEGKGKAFMFQQLEYALLRCLYKFHRKEQTVPVMPGAGCCYKRDILLSIYHHHSGLRNGEDREATLLGIKMGYRTKYMNNVQTLTRPPLTFHSLIKQRTRWYLGYLETLYKERIFYKKQISKRTVIGIRTMLDMAVVMFILLIPFILLVTGIIHPLIPLALLFTIYSFYITGSLHLVIVSPDETGKFSLRQLSAILLFPIIKISLEYIAWFKAFLLFRKKSAYYTPHSLKMTQMYRQPVRQTPEELVS